MNLFRLLLALLPARWRDSVARDLNEEASRAGRQGLAREAWLAWHVLLVAMRFHERRWSTSIAPRPRRRFTLVLRSDFRFALRMLIRQPASSAAIVVTLALGIGIVTSVFAVFNHVLFRPIPGVRDDGRLVTMVFQPAGKPNMLGSGARAALPYLRQASTLTGLAGRSETDLPVVIGSNPDPEIRRVQFVTSQFFDVLGVQARYGRLFADAEADGTTAIALVSDTLAARELGSAAAIGRSLIVNGQPFTIIGVVDRYRGWDATRVGNLDLWLPMGVEQAVTRSASPNTTFESLVAQRQSGASIEAVSAELTGIYTGHAGSFDDFTRQFVPVVYPGLHTFGQENSRARLMQTFPFLMGGAGLLLLVACANTANLLLARTSRRTRELAVQAALGARRLRLVRSLLVEAIVLAAAASGIGLALAALAIASLRDLQLFAWMPVATDLAIDARVTGFAMLLSGGTVLLFGLLPAIRASHADVRSLLPQASMQTPRSRRVRLTLVASQLAICLALLGAAGVLMRSLTNLRTQDVGMRTHDVVSFSLNPRPLGYSAARRDQLVRDVMARFEATPAIDAVAFASPPAFWGSGRTSRAIRLDASTPQPEVEAEAMTVSGSYFSVLGIPLVAGRTFRPDEFQQPARKSGGVAIVSASLARQLFGNQPAIGNRLVRGTWSAPTPAVMTFGVARGEFIAERDLDIVGVAADTRSGWTLRRGSSAMLYEPGGQRLPYGSFYLQSATPTAETTALARSVVRDIEPGLPLMHLGTVHDEIERLIPEDRLFARVMAIVACLAMLLGVAGTYAVTMSTVVERRREFGIRAALGAPASAIARGVLTRALITCAVGVFAGIGLFVAVSRVLSSQLYGVSALDPASLIGAAALLVLVTVLAAWLPARRATTIDPTIALRND